MYRSIRTFPCTDHFIPGGRYHAALSLKSYPPVTDELALLRCVGDMGGVNLRLTARQVTPAEEDAILHAAANKSRMERSNTKDEQEMILHNNPSIDTIYTDMSIYKWYKVHEEDPVRYRCGIFARIYGSQHF